MLDLGLDKLALIGAVALIVIGPEKLPKVARTVGHMMGKARRYVADVKAEVNRSIELEELQKARKQFEDAAQEVSSSVGETFSTAAQAVSEPFDSDAWNEPLAPPPSDPKPLRKNWRLKRSRTPQWFKHSTGVRQHVQSGAARVKRHRR